MDLGEVLRVVAGTARDVEHRAAVRPSPADQISNPSCLAVEVLLYGVAEQIVQISVGIHDLFFSLQATSACRTSRSGGLFVSRMAVALPEKRLELSRFIQGCRKIRIHNLLALSFED